MRYQTAAQDYNNNTTGTPTNPMQYLTIGIKNMKYGDIADLNKTWMLLSVRRLASY